MFEKNKLYKINIEPDNGFKGFFTGWILKDERDFVLIRTIKDEEVILRKDKIIKFVGVKDGQSKD